MNRLRIFSLVVLTAVVSCASTPSGRVRIDGSSPQACEVSWRKMEGSLNSQQRQQLELALLLIGSTKQHRSGTITTSQGISPATVREEIDGKDFHEIIALAKATGTTITNVQHPVRN
jgi:hypothetical protein